MWGIIIVYYFFVTFRIKKIINNIHMYNVVCLHTLWLIKSFFNLPKLAFFLNRRLPFNLFMCAVENYSIQKCGANTKRLRTTALIWLDLFTTNKVRNCYHLFKGVYCKHDSRHFWILYIEIHTTNHIPSTIHSLVLLADCTHAWTKDSHWAQPRAPSRTLLFVDIMVWQELY